MDDEFVQRLKAFHDGAEGERGPDRQDQDDRETGEEA